jgi:hypothetical protein
LGPNPQTGPGSCKTGHFFYWVFFAAQTIFFYWVFFCSPNDFFYWVFFLRPKRFFLLGQFFLKHLLGHFFKAFTGSFFL